MRGIPGLAFVLALLVACGAAATPAPSAPPAARVPSAGAVVVATVASSGRPLEHLTYALPSVSGLFLPQVQLAEELGFDCWGFT